MSWQDAMLADFTRFVHSRGERYEKHTIDSFEIDAEAYSLSEGCTCGYGSDANVDWFIRFYDKDNLIYTHYGDWDSLMDAINGLDEENDEQV